MGRLLDIASQALDHASSLLPPALLTHLATTLSSLPPLPPHLTSLPQTLNSTLAPYEPYEILLLTLLATLTAATLLRLASSLASINLASTFTLLRSIPFIKSLLDKEKAKLRCSLLASRKEATGPQFLELPATGIPHAQLLSMLRDRSAGDLVTKLGESKLSGALYMGSEPHRQLLDAAYSLFSLSNPLHADVWPSVRQMEAEVVSMTAGLLGGGAACPSVCGAMTSGGTESILSAMKASRDYIQNKRGIRAPEMILAKSAHAAYWKACEYFNIKPVVVNVGKDFRLAASTVRGHITSNTVVIIASAPGFPHGVVDHVSDISRLAQQRGICLHVDACLGGFVLPFARQLGHKIPPFDFSLPGVTSMSVDTHKFGMAHKGTSVVLYRSPDIRRFQFTGITDWTGGLYISPGMAGSRPGALIATAWSSLVHVGLEGYLEGTRRVMEVAQLFKDQLEQSVPELCVVGEPDMCVVAFRARQPKLLNIYKLNDALSSRGWHLNALQSPPALHFCFTAAHSPVLVQELIQDLKAEVAAVLLNPGAASGGSAPMYGMANAVPDRGMVAEFLVAFQDVMLEA